MIYKYFGFDESEVGGISICHTTENLKENQFFLRSAWGMNDPFECRVELYLPEITTYDQLKDMKKGVQRYIDGMINKRRLKGLRQGNWRQLKREVNKARLNDYKEKLELLANISTNHILFISHGLNVTCFSNTKESALMWSHYADGMRGICIGYEKSNQVKSVSVEYIDRPQRINLLDCLTNSDQEARSLQERVIKYKSLDWSYEEEVRVFHVSSFLKFRPEEIKELYIGFKISLENLDALEKALFEGGLDPRVCMAYLSQKSYEVQFDKITFNEFREYIKARDEDLWGVWETVANARKRVEGAMAEED